MHPVRIISVGPDPASGLAPVPAQAVTAMFNLSFEFNVEKLVHALAFFSKSGIRDLTKLKAAKLLYFADKEHLLEHGTPILGDVYFCMDFGPVPSMSLNEMSGAINGSEVPVTDASDASLFSKVLNVKKFFHRYPRFEVRDDAYNPSVFSETELSALRYTVNLYGSKSAQELVNMTHNEPTWAIPNEGRARGSRALITYDLFFTGAPERSRRFLAKLVAEQFGAAIPLAGDADYRAFTNELASSSFVSDEIPESDERRIDRYSRA
jgi:uncharacterized phage-associated protein